MSDGINLKELPDEDSSEYFRTLVRNCIETYKELPNDGMCLDFNKVLGKMRALVLDDAEYRQETRNIHARRQLKELREIDALGRLSKGGAEEDGRDADGSRGRGRGRRQPAAADKDTIAMRLKAAQLRREIIASMNEDSSVSERDAVNFLYVAVTREEVDKSVGLELYEGSDDDALDELASPKEEVPEGSSGKLRVKGQNGPLEDTEFFDTLPNGEIVER